MIEDATSQHTGAGDGVQSWTLDAGDGQLPSSSARGGAQILRRGARRSLVAGIIIVAGFCLIAIFADFLAPYDYRFQSRREPLAPPTAIHFRDAWGHWHARPFIYGNVLIDPLDRIYGEETGRSFPLALFVHGYPYRLLGIVSSDLHLFGVVSAGADTPRVWVLGADDLGRDRFARLLIASRFSLVVGPAGTLLAAVIGIVLGCLAGYTGRLTGATLMRAADVMMALPTLVLILAARAAFKPALSPLSAALLMILIFGAVGWAEIARLANGLVASLRRREFVTAAESIGLSQSRILFRHILPNAMRPLTVQVTLMLPAFLLAETALSFLGVGLQEPEPSWGTMLAAATDLNLFRRSTPLMLAPAIAIAVFVLGVRLISNGMKR